jgi:hypothetical protein
VTGVVFAVGLMLLAIAVAFITPAIFPRYRTSTKGGQVLMRLAVIVAILLILFPFLIRNN